MSEQTRSELSVRSCRDMEIVWLLRALLIVSIVGVALLAWDAID